MPPLREFLAIILFGVVMVIFRLHAFELPLETDECNYAYIGDRLTAGDQLYVDVWDHQPPGAFILFAGAESLFGHEPGVFRWMATTFSLVSLVLIYTLARRMGGITAAMTAAALFAIVSSDPGTAGEGCNREIFMNTLILGAWLMASRRQPGRSGPARHQRSGQRSVGQSPTYLTDLSAGSRWWLVGAGVALALGSALKTIVAVHWCILALWIVRLSFAIPNAAKVESAPRAADFSLPGRPRVLKHAAQGRVAAGDIMALGIAPALLWAGTFFYFTVTDRFTEFFDAVFLFNLGYSDASTGFFHRFVLFFTPQRHPFIFDSAWPLWVGTIGAVAWLVIGRLGPLKINKRRSVVVGHVGQSPTYQVVQSQAEAADQARCSIDYGGLVFVYIMASYIAVCLPGHFWPHYYYLLIPPAVLAVAVVAADLASRLQRRVEGQVAGVRVANVAICAIIPIVLLVTEYRSYLGADLFDITVKRYNSRDFWGRAQGRNVQRVTKPTDEIFVFGNDASIYYYAERSCASRYTMITGLGAGYTGVERRRKILLEELERHPPRVILVLFDEEPFDEWRNFLHRLYTEPIGWDFHDRTGKPIMFVVARKDDPIASINWDWDRSLVTEKK